ncbi:C-type lectin BfL-1 [Dirofilaria immitis]
MITENTGVFLVAIFSLAIFKDSVGLECYICDDENLDENGECHRQFHYDCNNYAKNFQPTEAIFCRTMRKRIGNAEVNGDEFAYCLCRKNLCNLKTIIDQFIDFEESHPEIFVTTNDDKHEHDEQFQIPTRDSRQLNYSSIRNIHQALQNI